VDRAYAAGLAVGIIVLVAIGAITLPPLASHGDFAEQWSAARLILEGGQPYDPATWQASAARLAGRASDSAVFIYPPYVALALVPLATLPVAAAATLWVAAGLIFAVLGIRSLLRMYVPPHPAVGALIGLTLVTSGPALLTLAQGQWGFLLVACGAAAVIAQRGDDGPTGAAAMVPFLLKPQLAPLVVLAFARGYGGRARRPYLGVIGAAALVILVTILALPSWWLGWYEGAIGFAATHPIRTTTLATTSEALLGAGGPIVAAAATITAVAVALAFDRRGDAHAAVWLATAVLVAPYIQAYDHLLLVVPLVIAIGLAGRRSPRASLVIAFAGAAMLVVGATASAEITIRSGRDVVGVGLWPDRRAQGLGALAVPPQRRDETEIDDRRDDRAEGLAPPTHRDRV
jgi:hypothetical protein